MWVSKFTAPRTVDVLRGALRRHVDAGTPVVEVCRQFGVSAATFFRWRKQTDDLGTTELGTLRQRRDEVRRLTPPSSAEGTADARAHTAPRPVGARRSRGRRRPDALAAHAGP